MKRVIVDYKKLTKSLLTLLVEKYPDGYADNDIISFKNFRNEAIDAVEIRTHDTIYLIKVSKRLTYTMENFAVTDENPDFTKTNPSESFEIPGQGEED